MKKLLVFLFFIFCVFNLSACSKQADVKTEKPAEAVSKPVENNPVLTASPEYANGLQETLNSGYKIVNNRVYITQSKDFEKVFFVGALVEKNGQIYNAIWATNNDTIFGMGLVFSVNDYAIEASGLGDGRTNAEPITENDDGYSRINQKLLSDWQK